MEDSKNKLNDYLSEFPKNEKVKEFINLMFGDDCIKDPDCEEIISTCCSDKLSVVFGSYPLRVKCVKCGVESLFRDMVLGSN